MCIIEMFFAVIWVLSSLIVVGMFACDEIEDVRRMRRANRDRLPPLD